MGKVVKVFKIKNLSITVSPSFERYNEIRNEFQNIARSDSSDLEESFSVKFDDMDDVIRKFPQVAQGYLDYAIDIAMNELVGYGVKDISDDEFFSDYVSKYMTLEDDFSFVHDEYMKLVLSAEEYKEYRKSGSKGGGFVGGGFGVQGAVEGMAIAAAANVVTGIVGGIFNSISDSLNESINKRDKAELYSSNKVRGLMARAVFSLVFNVHYALCDALQNLVASDVIERVSESNIKKSKAILNNIKKGRIKEDNVEAVLEEAIAYDPYCTEAYELCLDKNVSYRKGLKELENFFGILNERRLPKNLESPSPKRIIVENKSSADCVTNGIFNKSMALDHNPWVDPVPDSKEVNSGKKVEEIIDDQMIFDGKLYATIEEATRLRYQYVEKQISSGKSLDDGLKEEMEKILNEYPSHQRINTMWFFNLLFCFIGTIITDSPWWYGLISFFGFGIVLMKIGSNIDKKILIRWLDENRDKYGS